MNCWSVTSHYWSADIWIVQWLCDGSSVVFKFSLCRSIAERLGETKVNTTINPSGKETQQNKIEHDQRPVEAWMNKRWLTMIQQSITDGEWISHWLLQQNNNLLGRLKKMVDHHKRFHDVTISQSGETSNRSTVIWYQNNLLFRERGFVRES